MPLLPSGPQQEVEDFQVAVRRWWDAQATIPTAPSIPPTTTPEPTKTLIPKSDPTSVPPSPTTTPVQLATPHLRHIEGKRYMLELINTERINAGLQPVILGDNAAAQLHAEASLEGCFSSHWGLDGLKPYMRYSLAGGHQPNGENGHGSDYCIKASDRYRPISNVLQEIRESMEGWMDSPGHRDNILRPRHKKVNIGLAWDRYNFNAIQHFEGDYVEYERLPSIDNGVLSLSGTVTNGVSFEDTLDLRIRIYYDPPTSPLTRGQVSRTYCYGNGLHVASLREPTTGDLLYIRDVVTRTIETSSCPDPYDIPADSPAPRSPYEAHDYWQAAYDASRRPKEEEPIIVSRITTNEWTAADDAFSVTVDISNLLSQYKNGVYTLLVLAPLGDEAIVVSEYSMFLVDLPTSTGDPSTDSPKPTPTQSPEERKAEVMQHMIDIINTERTDAGLHPLVLGDNAAAQLHADASLEGCFSSHWGRDGLKPYMRYSLAGGYQSNSSSVTGSDYCITESDGYSPIDNIRGWMGIQALDPHYRRVNIGLAWDDYNFEVVLEFEGDYIEYERLPSIENDILSMSGTVKNGVTFEKNRELGVQIYYDPPSRPLTSGQISRIYCYDSGGQIASLREPLSEGWSYPADEYTTSYRPCLDPHVVPSDAPAPTSPDEARQLWRAARDESEAREPISVTVPWVTASEWITKGERFSVTADLRELLRKYGRGVYSIKVWGSISGEREVISEYSILHNVAPPDPYKVRAEE